MILYLRRFHGIEAGISEAHVGVWTGNEKIAALGISISRGVTMHGFALNINCDLAPFGWIVPCGITDRGVTSVARKTGSETDMNKARRDYLSCFCEVYGYENVEEINWPYPEKLKYETEKA